MATNKSKPEATRIWLPSPDRDARLASATKLIAAIARAPGLLDAHRKEFIRLALYKVTECDGKYGARYRTKDVYDKCRRQIEHEHVFRRGDLASEIIARPEDIEQICERAVACIVTVEDHQKLGIVDRTRPRITGWDRYKEAGLTVIDSRDGSTFIEGRRDASGEVGP